MSEPLVSCVCCTYARPVLLGEAVKCFIDQTYSNKELIIVNDQEGVILKLAEKRDDIRIKNIPLRFNSLGGKRNYAMSLTKGDYVCIWDDDDLYPPWRIKDSVDIMENNNYDIVKGKTALTSTHNKNYKLVSNLFHSQSIITREYVDSHSYLNKSVGEDVDYEMSAKIGSIIVDPFYFLVYRWGLGIHHLSGISNDKLSWEKSLSFEPYTQLKGEIVVKPEFTRNHWADIIDMFSLNKPEYADQWKQRFM